MEGGLNNDQSNNLDDIQVIDESGQANNNQNNSQNNPNNIQQDDKMDIADEPKENKNLDNNGNKDLNDKMDIEENKDAPNEDKKDVSKDNDKAEEGKEEPQKKERNSLIRLPLAKIKNIIKLDDDTKKVQKNAYVVIGKLTEIFLRGLALDAQKETKSAGRKMMSLYDISMAIKKNSKYTFIDFESLFHVENLKDKSKSARKPRKPKEDKPKPEIKEDIKAEDNAQPQPVEEEEIFEPKKGKGKKGRGKSANKKVKNEPIGNNMTIEAMFAKK